MKRFNRFITSKSPTYLHPILGTVQPGKGSNIPLPELFFEENLGNQSIIGSEAAENTLISDLSSRKA